MQKTIRDEYLEKLWYMKESNKDTVSDLKSLMKDMFDQKNVEELRAEGFLEAKGTNGNKEILKLSQKGLDKARAIVRAHRLAERLLYDVMGKNIEEGACEFEHMVTAELVDSICILLGHPKECPHGLPIPEGECCKSAKSVVNSLVTHMSELEVGQTAKIAYLNCRDDQQLHKMNSLQLRPGIYVKVHQRYPSFVIECEGANIALDNDVAYSICVWSDTINSAGRQ
ncbi:MAG: metal-dependent transcriptional regulator [Nitrospirae bacterium]|nr:metal-dependent transcriptional regulator [Nitrospirota bacterium]